MSDGSLLPARAADPLRAGWIACQIGSREQYALARGLYRNRALECLFTDLWTGPANPLSRVNNSLRNRFHPELGSARVEALNLRMLAFELGARLRKPSVWAHTIARNRYFQDAVLARLSRMAEDGHPRVLVAYSYAALKLLRFARSRGWRTALAQIDPGLFEEKLVAKLHEESAEFRGQMHRPPASYWTEWRAECEIADRIVVNSEWSRTALANEGIPEGKIRIVPLAYERPVPAVRFRRSYPAAFGADRRLRVLFLGQINLRKGVGALFDAIRILAEEPIEFWFVGPVQITVPADLRSSNRVKWLGPVAHDATEEFYRDADVFIIPTHSDGFALTQLEARAWRLPVIATAFCGEVVKDGKNGWLLPNVSGETIASALRSALAAPARLAAYADMVETELGVTELGDLWLRLFDN